MNRQVVRMVAGANLVAGCLLLQGCGMFGKKQSDQGATTLPEGEPVAAQPAEPTPAEPVVTAPAELPVVQATTPYTIQKNDTFSSVAYKYGLRWQDVVAVNPGVSANRLRLGQVIQLPGQVDVSKAKHMPASTPKAKATAPKTSAPKASAAASGPAVTYVVKSGDSLSLIALKHGVKQSVLREANNLKTDKIVVGQKLKVPGAKKSADAGQTAKKASASAPKTDAPKKSAVVETQPVAVAPAAATVAPPPAVEAAAAPAAAPAAEAAPAAAAAATTPAPAADSNTQTYTVKEGEDLYAVAIRWGVSPSDLKALNNLTSTELKAGTVLKIPGGAQ